MVFIRRYLFLFFTFFISSNILISAPVIEQAKDKKNKTEIIEKNISLIREQINTKVDSIKDLILETLKLSKEIDYQIGIENSYLYLGRFFYLHNCYDSAMHYYKIGMEKARINKSELITSFYVGMANIYWDTGDYSGGLEISFEIKRLFESMGIIDQKYEIFNYLGLYYEGILEYNSALENYQKSTEIALKRGESDYAGVVYANMGSVYSKIGKYDTSIIFSKQGVVLEVENKLYRNAGRTYAALATVSLKLNQIDSASFYLEEALRFNNLSNDSTGLVRTYIAFGKYYIKINEYKKSIDILTEAIPIATKYQNKSELVELYDLLAKNYYKTGNYKESSRYSFNYIELYQKVYDIKKINQVSALEHQLKITQQENEINLLKIEKQQFVTNYLLIIAILLLIISTSSIVFVIYFKKINRRLLDQNIKISEQKEILEELNEQLILAEKNISKADELKSSFINILSHEIRTPLNGIVGFSSLMVDSEISNEEKIEASNIIKKNSDDLINTIEGLVDLSLIKSDQLFVFKEEFDLYDFINRLHKDFLYIRNNLYKDHLELQCVPDLNYKNYTIKSDTNLLKKSLTKLINNAFKYTMKGKVDYGFTISNSLIIFFITDTGIGISEESRPTIFSQFEKGKNLPKNTGGLGISLALTKNYIELLGGKIWYESTVNKGTTFYFEIPTQ
jgi:signal transduction histidine kinase